MFYTFYSMHKYIGGVVLADTEEEAQEKVDAYFLDMYPNEEVLVEVFPQKNLSCGYDQKHPDILIVDS